MMQNLLLILITEKAVIQSRNKIISGMKFILSWFDSHKHIYLTIETLTFHFLNNPLRE